RGSPDRRGVRSRRRHRSSRGADDVRPASRRNGSFARGGFRPFAGAALYLRERGTVRGGPGSLREVAGPANSRAVWDERDVVHPFEPLRRPQGGNRRSAESRMRGANRQRERGRSRSRSARGGSRPKQRNDERLLAAARGNGGGV